MPAVGMYLITCLGYREMRNMMLKAMFLESSFFWFYIVLAAAVFFIAGCGDYESSIFGQEDSTELSEVVSSVNYLMICKPGLEAIREFSQGQVPAIRIYCHNGDVAGFLLKSKETGRLIMGHELNLKSGKVLYQPFPHLAAGTYIVRLRGSGDAKEGSCEFVVLEG